MNNEIKAGDKVKIAGSALVGKVHEVHGDTVTVLWPIKGRMFPVARLEQRRDLQVVK